MAREPGRAPASRLELAGALLILLAGLVPRLRDVAAPFDRGVEGARGASFAIAAVNYERLGLGRAGGYPVHNVDALREARPGVLLPIPSEHWLVDATHPPLVPLLAWVALEALGPEGWSEAWRSGRAPRGVELPLRLPFALVHALFLAALWWAVREGHGRRTALIALALAAAAPVLAFHGALVGAEGPALLCLALAAGFHARWRRVGRRADLGRFALVCSLGACVGNAGACFVPFFALATLAAGRIGRGVAQAAVGIAAALVPVALHALWIERVARDTGHPLPNLGDRAREALAPLAGEGLPHGGSFTRELERLGPWIGWPVVALALAGLALLLARLSRPPPAPAFAPRWQHVDVGVPLFLGGWLYFAATYRHAAEHHLMLVAPGFAVLAAVALDALAAPLARLRAGIAPLVVIVSSIALLGVRELHAQRYRSRAPLGEPAPAGLAPPALPLPDATGAELASLIPPGSVGLYPSETDLNLAAGFYAWRSLFPIAAPGDAAPAARARAAGLEQAARYLLLPTPPPAGVEEQAASLRAALAPPVTPRQAGARWESILISREAGAAGAAK
jgi:hypothetical protein